MPRAKKDVKLLNIKLATPAYNRPDEFCAETGMSKTVATENTDRAAELERDLKNRIDSLPYHGLVKDIKIDTDENADILRVTIVPLYEVVTFSRFSIRLVGIDTEEKWRRRKKDAYGQVKRAHPVVSRFFKEMIQKEASAKLKIWRQGHSFSGEMTEILSAAVASDYISSSNIAVLQFLAGSESLVYASADIGTEHITAAFKVVPFKAVYYLASGMVKVSFSAAEALYKKLEKAVESYRIQNRIEEYLRVKEIQASIMYTGKPGEFRISFDFGSGQETETVAVENAYKRIVSAAYRTARDRAAKKKKEQEEYLKTCPAYGMFIAQAVIDTIEDNRNRLTEGQIVNILRGTNLSEDYVFGRYTGKYRLLQKSEISDVISTLERFGIISKRCVHGRYQNYYVYSVTQAGRLFSELQSIPVPRRVPVTEQEYYLVLKAVKNDIGRNSDRKWTDLLRVIAEKPGIFLTDPGLVLDCVELMGKPAEEYLKGCCAKEGRRARKDILRLLVNAAAGKGKVLPKNGLTAFREREEKKRREKEASELKDQELFQLVLTEISNNYADLYPAARSMQRHFVLHIGPTNSGKTHDAIEELMQADNGIYLAPLRLLAYEQYEQMNRAGCPCSLVTGEEQFIEEGARHQSSTIEMLSLNKRYDVAVIDEAQMIADSARGGAWTSAIMGVCASRVHVCAAPEAEARIVEIIRDCRDDYEIIRHRRMTPLLYENKIIHFPKDIRKGDALIVFSRSSVHEVAEQLKKRHVACSIIYGALPYDVRHKQAELFADGVTDVVVATDAIGMGMNLPIRRVVLMEMEKFDGFKKRPLRYDEIRQIVGRAGRYGIYDTGYASSANGDERIKTAIDNSPRPIGRAVIDFPETLLTVDAPILDLIKKWEEVIPAKGWQKESISKMRRLAEMTKDLNAPKRLAYDFLTIPFEEDNDVLLDIWYRAFVKEARGEEYSIYDLVDSMELKEPSSADAVDTLEQQHQILDLYFNLARRFQPLESTLDLIMEKKRICSGWIMKVLEIFSKREVLANRSTAMTTRHARKILPP